METADRGRNTIEASNDLAYEIRLHERHIRLYRKIRQSLALIALCGGGSAFANMFVDRPLLGAIGGAVVAASAYCAIAFNLESKVVAHDTYRKLALDLQARETGISIDQFDSELSKLSRDDPGAIEALRQPAHNDMLRTRGYPEYVQPLSRTERLMNWIA